MTHKQKVKKAKRMMTPGEVRASVSIFDSKAWNARKKARHESEAKRHKDALKRKRNERDNI
jgi:hypothetical protein